MDELPKVAIKDIKPLTNVETSTIEFQSSPGSPDGMRIYKNSDFPNTESAQEILTAMMTNKPLGQALVEATLSLNLPDNVQSGTPKLEGIGIAVPGDEGSFYYAVNPKTMQGTGIYDVFSFLWSQGIELKKAGKSPKIFTLVEQVPIAISALDLDKFQNPYRLVDYDIAAYKMGLVAGLRFYLEAYKHGYWNFDTVANAPFLCDRKGNIKVIDTSGFIAIPGSAAEELLNNFYEFELGNREPEISREIEASSAYYQPYSNELDKSVRNNTRGILKFRDDRLTKVRIPTLQDLINLLNRVGFEKYLRQGASNTVLEDIYTEIKNGEYYTIELDEVLEDIIGYLDTNSADSV